MRKSRSIKLGRIEIGGANKPVLQTMITTPLSDYRKAISEADSVYNMGCPVVRTAFKSMDEAQNLEKFAANFAGEVIADIHFDYKLVLAAIDAGVSGIRINPGNIGGKERAYDVIEKAKKRPEMALRIGVNSGSLEKDIIAKYNGVTAAGLTESMKRWIDFIEKELDYKNFKISIKSSSVRETVESCKEIAKFTDAPFHVGITEAGAGIQGIVKSAMGIGILFHEGLVDTFRVSLTAPIKNEIITGFHILKAYDILDCGGEIISCPTCGRTHGTLFKYYNRLEEWFEEHEWWKKPLLKAAVMGCEVNGPGEAKEADLGIALGVNCALYFEKNKEPERFENQDKAFNHLISVISKKWGI